MRFESPKWKLWPQTWDFSVLSTDWCSKYILTLLLNDIGQSFFLSRLHLLCTTVIHYPSVSQWRIFFTMVSVFASCTAAGLGTSLVWESCALFYNLSHRFSITAHCLLFPFSYVNKQLFALCFNIQCKMYTNMTLGNHFVFLFFLIFKSFYVLC